MMMGLKELHAKLQALLLQARAICDAADQGKRDYTADERQKLQGLITEAAAVKEQIKQAQGDAALRKQLQDMGFEPPEGPDGVPAGGPAATKGTLGEQFVNAPAYKSWLKTMAPGGEIPQTARGLHSPPVEFRRLLPRGKTLITGLDDAQAGAFVQTDYTGLYEPLGRRPLALRDLITPGTTTSDLVEFVRQVAQVTQATPVAEATATDTGGTKPEGAIEFEQVTAAVKNIAVWIPATKRALSDAGQLRGIIDSELRDDLEEDLEDEILDGSGLGIHFLGILNTPGLLTQAWDTDILTTMRKALTTVRVTGRVRPSAWLLNPIDWETIELEKDDAGRFYGNGPFAAGVKSVWGTPVVDCEAMPEGTGLLGDFRKAKMWDRERATIQVSDSHEDFFIRNLVAILAEMRAAFGVIRPSGFVITELVAGS